MLTILFTMTPAFDPFAGGVQQTTFKLGRYFHEQGHRVYYFSMSEKGHKPCKYGILHFSDAEGGQCNDENNYKLCSTIEYIRPDVVINQMPYEEKMRNTLYKSKVKFNFLLLGCLRNALFSVKNNLDDYAKYQLPGPLKSLSLNTTIQKLFLKLHKKKHAKDLRAILDAHDYFVLLTPSNKMELEWFVGKYKENKVKVIPNSIPFVTDSKDSFPKRIVHVGRLSVKQKRSDLLIPLWKKLADQLPDWEFVIVGDGPYKSAMEDEISKNSLPRIKLVGYADPKSWYSESSIFVMTSSFEGFPNVLIEAQSYGLVSFAFDSYPALRDIIIDKKNGFAISAFNIDEMANEVINIITDEEMLLCFSKASLENACKYTTPKIGDHWLHFFNTELIR